MAWPAPPSSPHRLHRLKKQRGFLLASPPSSFYFFLNEKQVWTFFFNCIKPYCPNLPPCSKKSAPSPGADPDLYWGGSSVLRAWSMPSLGFRVTHWDKIYFDIRSKTDNSSYRQVEVTRNESQTKKRTQPSKGNPSNVLLPFDQLPPSRPSGQSGGYGVVLLQHVCYGCGKASAVPANVCWLHTASFFIFTFSNRYTNSFLK